MSHPIIVADECVSCGACVDACPCEVLELGDECAQVADADSCVGCGACLDACPTGAISMLPDEEGFLYPRIDEDSCICCLRCLSVCAFKVDQAARGV